MKIKYALLEKLADLTNREMDFLLYIARHQDVSGRVYGVYYRDVCEHAQMCKQSFYDTMRSLQEKGVIRYAKATRIDYDITILENDFSRGTPDYKEGYINLSRAVFHSRDFKRLKAKEKFLLLNFLKSTHSNNASYRAKTDRFFDSLKKVLRVTKRVIRGYLHSLRRFFSMGIKGGIYYVTYRASVFNAKITGPGKKAEEDFFLEDYVRTCCRRSKIKNPEEGEIANTAGLIKQYGNLARQTGYDILDAISQCIGKVSGEHKPLNGRYVHKLVRQALQIA